MVILFFFIILNAYVDLTTTFWLNSYVVDALKKKHISLKHTQEDVLGQKCN